MLYFGYGSNLEASDLARWGRERGLDASGMHGAGAAHLPEHRLAFHYHSRARMAGALDVCPSPGDATPGALFEVDAAGAALLDAKEGAPQFYERREVLVLDAAGQERAATTYVVSDARRESRHVPPTSAYLDVVRSGLAAHGLSITPLQRAAAGLEGEPWPGAVFVYGTLRAGQARAGMLRGVRVAAKVRGRLVDRGAYPGLLLEGEGEVVGQRVPVSVEELAQLDAVEGFLGFGAEGSLFRRVLVHLQDHSWAWSYLWLGEPSPSIESGDWLARRER